MDKWIKIFENDSFIVDFNETSNIYRVSYFEDYHFQDEVCFKGYDTKGSGNEKTSPTNELQKEISKLMQPPYIYKDDKGTTVVLPSTCETCSNHPSNGGSGLCSCTLDQVDFTCVTKLER